MKKIKGGSDMRTNTVNRWKLILSFWFRDLHSNIARKNRPVHSSITIQELHARFKRVNLKWEIRLLNNNNNEILASLTAFLSWRK